MMTNTPSDPDVNDPATEQVVQRARKVSAVSISIMLVGVATVLGVIAFRMLNTAPTGPIVTGTIDPQAGRVVSAVASGNQLTITFERDGVPAIVVYDLKTLKETHRVTFQAVSVPRP